MFCKNYVVTVVVETATPILSYDFNVTNIKSDYHIRNYVTYMIPTCHGTVSIRN